MKAHPKLRIAIRVFIALAAVALVWCAVKFWKDYTHYGCPCEGFGRTPPSDITSIKSVTTIPMPDAPAPDDWVLHNRNGIEFLLPPEFAVADKPHVFTNGTKKVFVNTLNGYTWVYEPMITLMKAEDKLLSEFFTSVYAVSYEDKDLPMTPAQSETYYKILDGRLHGYSATHTESLTENGIDGFAEFCDDWKKQGCNVKFHFRLANMNSRTYIIEFTDWMTDGDFTWARTICRSIRPATTDVE